jgi:hypothetical protein
MKSGNIEEDETGSDITVQSKSYQERAQGFAPRLSQALIRTPVPIKLGCPDGLRHRTRRSGAHIGIPDEKASYQYL